MSGRLKIKDHRLKIKDQSFQQPFRFLIYNGDVDTVCNYLGDAWLMRDVANNNIMAVSGIDAEYW